MPKRIIGISLVLAALSLAWYLIPRDTGSVLAELPRPGSAPPADTLPIPGPDGDPGPRSVPTTPELGAPVLTPRSGAPTVSIPVVPPARVRIPAIGVDAPIVALGVDRDGLMEIPENVDDVGWYRHGPGAGGPGSSVLAAHIDSAGQGPGVFFRLGTLGRGDLIEVSDTEGNWQTFVVRAVETIPKDELALDRVFAREGDPVLTLITCGGGFSRSLGSYDSNVVVVAVPLAPADTGGTGAR